MSSTDLLNGPISGLPTYNVKNNPSILNFNTLPRINDLRQLLLAISFNHVFFDVVQDLRKRFEKAVGHEVSLYDYGDNGIKDRIVAVIAGGGNNIDMLEEIIKAGVNTFVTGITVKNEHSRKAHEFAKEHKINILGGTHYSTEKFACIAMCDYFGKIGLPFEFIEDKPVTEDI
jgi:putative NIF3 family GTP cyclohydrolase 1 type 2